MLYTLTTVLIGLILRWGYGLRIEGLENLPSEGRVIVACNHVSWIDPPLVGYAISLLRKPFFLAKEELFRNPLASYVLRELNSVPLDRLRADLGAVRQAKQILDSDKCLVLFPEGTRSRTGEPGKPKPGVAYLAEQTGSLVVPARVLNTEHFPRTSRLRVRFGRPINWEKPENNGNRNVRSTSKQAYREFVDELMRNIFSL